MSFVKWSSVLPEKAFPRRKEFCELLQTVHRCKAGQTIPFEAPEFFLQRNDIVFSNGHGKTMMMQHHDIVNFARTYIVDMKRKDRQEKSLELQVISAFWNLKGKELDV